MDSKTKYAILGSGCIGCCVGITLALSLYDVSFIGRKNSEKFAKIQARKTLALTFPEPGSNPSVLKSDNITTDEETGLTGRGVVFVATKRTANQAAAEAIARYSPQGAIVVMLQNGLDASKDVLGVFQNANRTDLIVFDSVVNFNVMETAPGEFSWIWKRSASCIALDGSSHPGIAEDNVCAALRAAGIDSYAEKDFIEIATGKMIINLANAPNALAGCDTQQMFYFGGYRRVWSESIREARAVFRAMGVKTQRSPRDHGNFIVKHLEWILGTPDFVAIQIAKTKQTKGGKTSMLQDLENHADFTEIDFLNGKLVNLGEQLNVPTPVNAKIVELIKQAETKREGSPKMSPDELLSACGLPSSSNRSCVIC